jgi:VWFA-related protein
LLITTALSLLLQQSPAVSMETRALRVAITDRDDNAAAGLVPEDFVIIEDGVAREVVEVRRDARRPTLALIVDTSAAVSTDYHQQVLPAVVGFLRLLSDDARFALWTTGDRPTKILDYESDIGSAASALRRIAPEGGNTLFDAIDQALEDLVEHEGHRLVLVIVSGSGLEVSSHEEPRSLHASERRSNVEISSILVRESCTPAPILSASDTPAPLESRARYESVLSRLAQRSGGRSDSLLTFMSIDKALKQIAAEISSTYTIVYRAPSGTKPRKTKINVARATLKVRVLDSIRSP